MELPSYIVGSVQSKAYRVLREHVYNVLSKYELTPTHWSMLGIIIQSPDGIRQVEIAERLHVKAPLVTNLARQLQTRDIVQSVQNQFDARAKLLAITVSGRKFVKTVEEAVYENLEPLINGLTEDELATYYKVLTTIIVNNAVLEEEAAEADSGS